MLYENAVQIIEQQYKDNFGLIVQKDKDPGDSSSREGIYYYLRSINEGSSKELSESFNKALDLIEIRPGIYIRHPFVQQFKDETYVYNENEFSRDQTVPLIVGLGEFPEQKERLNRLFKAQQRRSWHTFQNGDWLGPMELNAYIRAYNDKWLYPVVIINDLGLLVNASIRCFKRLFWPSDTSDDVVLSLLFVQAKQRLPTPVSWLSRQVYKLSKPKKALEMYFSQESGAPPLNIFYPDL